MKLYLNKEQLEYQHHRWGEDNPVPSASGASHYCTFLLIFQKLKDKLN